MTGGVRTAALAALMVSALWSGAAVAEESGGRVAISAGTVVMGTDPERLEEQIGDPRARAVWFMDETPVRKVEVGAFMIDRTEVTNERFATVFKNSHYPGNLAGHPAVNVSWGDADEFCRAQGGRLPTEAEWERAARGDDGRIFPWGDRFDPKKAVYMDSSRDSAKLKVGSFELQKSGANLLGGTFPAGSREEGKSPFGVYDMAGNVWEWVDGWYDKARDLRTLKGGSWLSPKASVRISARLPDMGDGVYNDYGFRCAYDID